MTNKQKIIYLAGLIDGEAWIGINKHKPRNITGNPVYVPVITIKMADDKPLKVASSVLGGKVYTHNTLTKGGLIPYSWRVCNAPACISALEKLIPFLVSKKKVAKVVLKYCYRIVGTRPAMKLPKKEISFRHNIYITCKELNALN